MAKLTKLQNSVWKRWVLGHIRRMRIGSRGAETELEELVRAITTGKMKWRGKLPCRDWSQDEKYKEY